MLNPASCPLSNLLDWVEIPPGEFQMGGLEEDKFVSSVELPRHRVVIGCAFALSRGPVTRRLWETVMGALPPGNRKGLSDNAPVVAVSWSEALAFCREVGGGTRLPSEAEWEFACRGGSVSVFPHGAALDAGDANFLYDEWGRSVGCGAPSPVGRYLANALGLHDMLGNVCEWTTDLWHPGYAGAPVDGRAWLEGCHLGRRAIRGGAWDHLPRVLRASWRDWAPESARWDNLGFRIARDV